MRITRHKNNFFSIGASLFFNDIKQEMGIIQTIVTKMQNVIINRNGLLCDFDNREVGVNGSIRQYANSNRQ